MTSAPWPTSWPPDASWGGSRAGWRRGLGRWASEASWPTPRSVENRDKVNTIIKFREYWRPFCPSMTAEAAPDYFDAFPPTPRS